MLPWFQSMLSPAECCTTRDEERSYQQSLKMRCSPPSGIDGPSSPTSALCRDDNFHAERVHRFRPHRRAGSCKRSLTSFHNAAATNLSDLPDDFCMRLSDLCINHPRVVAELHDEANSKFIWGEAKSLRFRFMQMCIRGHWGQCSAIWRELGEHEQNEFVSVYRNGNPSQDFFFDRAPHLRTSSFEVL